MQGHSSDPNFLILSFIRSSLEIYAEQFEYKFLFISYKVHTNTFPTIPKQQQYSSSVFEQVSVSLVAGHLQPLAHTGLLRHLQFSSQKFHPKDNQLLGTRNENCLCSTQRSTATAAVCDEG